MAAMDFQQTLQQSQIQVMSQKQIQAMNMLAMGSSDLREEIYRQVQENPALEIVEDFESGGKKNSYPVRPQDTRISSRVSLYGQEASDTYQMALEAKEDARESLHSHLLSQLHMESLSAEEAALGEKLIYNLSNKGFHVLAPVSFISQNQAKEETALLGKMISMIQAFSPEGCCTKNSEESLYVQAKLKDKNETLALFILNGRLSLINPPVAERAAKKISAYLGEQKKLFALADSDEISRLELSDITVQSVQEAIDFIRTLNPFPAQGFGTQEAHYVSPDVYVELASAMQSATVQEEEPLVQDDFSKGRVVCKTAVWNVRTAKESLPRLRIDKSFQNLSESKNKTVTEGIKKARDFMESIQFREDTLLSAACIIVKKQNEFFSKGPGHLVPLRQKDVADILNVHETTISRMANSKYIQCQWGLFEIKYFFTNAVSDTSKDRVLHQIKEILEEHKNDAKRLSDQKISEALAAKGIQVARRTVAKYRAQLSIESSYNRD